MLLNEIKKALENQEAISVLFPKHIRIEEMLAKGGQGIVFKGLVNGEEAAIKIYFPGQVQLRVERETEALTNLDNRHIVKLLWKGTITFSSIELQTVATNFVKGSSLSRYLSGNQLSSQQTGLIAHDIAKAILAMWEQRIVHRDLKPDNILIGEDNRACVIDLGVARHVERTPITATGLTWGTEGYMSPEQTKAIKQLTCKSDIYALGVILVECGIGRHPTMHDQMRLISSSLHKNLPMEINSWEYASLISAMLDPKPTKRPLPMEIINKTEKFVYGGEK